MLGGLFTHAAVRSRAMTSTSGKSRIVPYLAALCVVSGGCSRDRDGESDASSGPILLGPESLVVARVRPITTGPRISGSLEAKERAMIAAEVSGSVLEVAVELGDEVKVGQTLARIEAIGSTDTVRSARSAVESAEQAAVLARHQAKRSAALVASGAQAEAQLEVDRNAVAVAAAQVEEARARLVVAGKQLGDATVLAPMNGVVSELPVHKGDVVSSGARLMTIIDPSSMRLEAAVPSVYLPELEQGAAVAFEVRGRPGETFAGEITRIAPAADSATRQIPILISIPNPARTLLAGLFAEGRIASKTVSGVVLPLDAVQLGGVHPTVTVVRDGKAQRVQVELGVRDDSDELVQIASGLSEGEHVVRGTAGNLTAGTPVKLIDGPNAAPAPDTAPAPPPS
jgi:RND family efflux transporter MFP subunit